MEARQLRHGRHQPQLARSMSDARRWWSIDIRLPGDIARFSGRVEATRAELEARLGPSLSIEPNGHVIVYGPPRRSI
jgi:hypothetical protein